MAELPISDDLVGTRVVNPVRPEWGAGTVLRVQAVDLGGQPAHRVSVQFATGHRTMMVPPGRLMLPTAEPTRAAGWLDQLGKSTLDHQLRALPERVREFLGTSAQRLVVLAPLYECDGSATALLRWARSQTGVADPLTIWSRDELREAFAAFQRQRDVAARDAVQRVRATAGGRGLRDALAEVPEPARGIFTVWAGLSQERDEDDPFTVPRR
ncbi:MAG: DUF3553 domain-containing protein [Phycisphaerales bacterium]|nr:DUF3553 domain-containing protein [Phycisphaerales bacterium]